MTQLYGMIMIVFLILSGCSKAPKKDEALPAHNAAIQVKEEWSKVEKPLELVIEDRSQEELQAIGSIAVAIEGQSAVSTFTLRDSVFVPSAPILADSTVRATGFYPDRPDFLSDTLAFGVPMPSILIGRQTSVIQTKDKITVKMKLNEITALLRVKLESDNPTDILKILSLSGRFVTGIREPNSGKWLEVRTSGDITSAYSDCILNNGRVHTFNLLPSEHSNELGIAMEVGENVFTGSVEIPPLRAGSVTELRLRLTKGKLSVGSSWVDTEHTFEKPYPGTGQAIEIGHYLNKDESFSTSLTDESVAIVIDTDGKHGKAVSLTDNDNADIFTGNYFGFGATFDTVDGKFSEGCFNASLAEDDESKIAFSPNVNYRGDTAFSLRCGAISTNKALLKVGESRRNTFLDNLDFPTAYVPSLFELAQLAQYVATHQEDLPEGFEVPENYLISCCEKDKTSFYSLHVLSCRITHHNSMRYSTASLRLFYLF